MENETLLTKKPFYKRRLFLILILCFLLIVAILVSVFAIILPMEKGKEQLHEKLQKNTWYRQNVSIPGTVGNQSVVLYFFDYTITCSIPGYMYQMIGEYTYQVTGPHTIKVKGKDFSKTIRVTFNESGLLMTMKPSFIEDTQKELWSAR